MKKIIFIASVVAIVVVLVLPTPSLAQVTFRRPIDLTTAINSYFDNNLSITGTQKYDCSTSTTRSDHQGVDFPVPIGTPVIVAAAGRVYNTWNNCKDSYDSTFPTCGGVPYYDSTGQIKGNSYGNQYRVDHATDTADGKGLVSIYAHMKASSVTIPVGTPVSCSQQLGQSAASGYVTGTNGQHLHFELRTDGLSTNTKIDPYIGSCSHLTPPSWTAVSNGQPTTQCDNRPLAPSNVSVTNPTTSSLVVNFKDNALNETSITIERKIGPGSWTHYGYFNALSGASSWNWTNSGLSSGTTYCYRLKSVNAFGSSVYSNESCGATLSASSLPLAPSNVVITNATTNSLQINFTDNATNETNILIERKIGISGSWVSLGGFGALTGTGSWYWINTLLASKITYCYRLKAVNAVGSSAYSNEACGTTL